MWEQERLLFIHSPFSKNNWWFITRIFHTWCTSLKGWLAYNAHFIFVVVIIVIEARYSPCPLGYSVQPFYFYFELGCCLCIVVTAVVRIFACQRRIIVSTLLLLLLLLVIAWRSPPPRWWRIHLAFGSIGRPCHHTILMVASRSIKIFLCIAKWLMYHFDILLFLEYHYLSNLSAQPSKNLSSLSFFRKTSAPLTSSTLH